MSLGTAIKRARVDRRMPQNELQRLAHISQNYLSKIELDKVMPRWHIVVDIANALDISLDQLAERKGTADAATH